MRATCIGLLLTSVAGCADPLVPPDISELSVSVRWSGDSARAVAVSIRGDIPCEGTEHGLLGESGVHCESAPWELVIDGLSVETTAVTCTSAHYGFFGPVEKYCSGGTADAPLPDVASEDVEIVARTASAETRRVIHGARSEHTFIAEAPYRSASEPGIARVDGLELVGDSFTALFTAPAGGEPIRGRATILAGDTSRMQLSASSIVFPGDYGVRVLALTRIDDVRVAVPIDGTMTADPQ